MCPDAMFGELRRRHARIPQEEGADSSPLIGTMPPLF